MYCSLVIHFILHTYKIVTMRMWEGILMAQDASAGMQKWLCARGRIVHHHVLSRPTSITKDMRDLTPLRT